MLGHPSPELALALDYRAVVALLTYLAGRYLADLAGATPSIPVTEGPTMGYGKQTVQIDFPELSDPDVPEDLIYVRILNPRLVSQDMLTSDTEVEIVDGKPVDAKAAKQASLEVIAGLVRAWNVYDPSDDSDNPTPFPMPATAEMVGRLPFAIQTRLMKTVNEAIDPK